MIPDPGHFLGPMSRQLIGHLIPLEVGVSLCPMELQVNTTFLHLTRQMKNPDKLFPFQRPPVRMSNIEPGYHIQRIRAIRKNKDFSEKVMEKRTSQLVGVCPHQIFENCGIAFLLAKGICGGFFKEIQCLLHGFGYPKEFHCVVILCFGRVTSFQGCPLGSSLVAGRPGLFPHGGSGSTLLTNGSICPQNHSLTEAFCSRKCVDIAREFNSFIIWQPKVRKSLNFAFSEIKRSWL